MDPAYPLYRMPEGVAWAQRMHWLRSEGNEGRADQWTSKLRARLGHAGNSRDPLRNFRLGGCVADKRLPLGCRGRADPCQLALYVHCRHAHEQEAGGYRCGSGGIGCANNDRNLGTIARSPNKSRHRGHARLSVGSCLMDASASRSERLDRLFQHDLPLLLHQAPLLCWPAIESSQGSCTSSLTWSSATSSVPVVLCPRRLARSRGGRPTTWFLNTNNPTPMTEHR